MWLLYCGLSYGIMGTFYLINLPRCSHCARYYICDKENYIILALSPIILPLFLLNYIIILAKLKNY